MRESMKKAISFNILSWDWMRQQWQNHLLPEAPPSVR